MVFLLLLETFPAVVGLSVFSESKEGLIESSSEAWVSDKVSEFEETLKLLVTAVLLFFMFAVFL